MRKLIRSLSQWVGNLTRTNRLPVKSSEAHVSSIVLAMTLGYRLPMPSSPVERPEEWYIVNCFAGVEERLGRINEETVIYLTDALNLTKQIWLKRYRLLHSPYSAEAISLLRNITTRNDRSIPAGYKDVLAKVHDGELQEIVNSLSEIMTNNEKVETETNV